MSSSAGPFVLDRFLPLSDINDISCRTEPGLLEIRREVLKGLSGWPREKEALHRHGHPQPADGSSPPTSELDAVIEYADCYALYPTRSRSRNHFSRADGCFAAERFCFSFFQSRNRSLFCIVPFPQRRSLTNVFRLLLAFV